MELRITGNTEKDLGLGDKIHLAQVIQNQAETSSVQIETTGLDISLRITGLQDQHCSTLFTLMSNALQPGWMHEQIDTPVEQVA